MSEPGSVFESQKVFGFESGTRSQMLQVGTKLVEKDTGVLSVTSTRLVFSGRTTARENLYTKVENLTVSATALPSPYVAVAT